MDGVAAAVRTDLRRVLAATLLTQAAATWALLAVAAVSPLVAASLGVDPVLIGWQIALLYVFAASTSLIAGGLVARWGAARTSQVALLAGAVGVAIISTGTAAGIAVASALIGFGYGITNPAASHLLVTRTTPRDRSFVFSIKQTGVPLGAAAAGLVTPSLALAFGWQAAVAAVAPVALLLALAIQPAREGWDADRRPDAGLISGAADGWRMVRGDPRLMGVCLCALCFGAIQLSLMGFVVAYAAIELGFGAVAAGSLLAAVQVAGATGRLSWGWIADRMRSNPLVLAGIAAISAACCLGFGLLTPATPQWVVYAVAMAFGLSAVGWNGVFFAEVARLAPEGRVGAATGFATVMTFGGVVIGPSVFMVLHDLLGGYAPAYLTLAVPALAGGAFALRAARRR